MKNLLYFLILFLISCNEATLEDGWYLVTKSNFLNQNKSIEIDNTKFYIKSTCLLKVSDGADSARLITNYGIDNINWEFSFFYKDNVKWYNLKEQLDSDKYLLLILNNTPIGLFSGMSSSDRSLIFNASAMEGYLAMRKEERKINFLLDVLSKKYKMKVLRDTTRLSDLFSK